MLKELLQERKLPEIPEREEILSILQKEIFGFLPPKPASLEFEVLKERVYPRFCAGHAACVLMQANCTVNGKTFSFPFHACYPLNGKPNPVVVFADFEATVPNRYYPAEEILDQGFAVLSFCYHDVTADVDDDFSSGLSKVLYPDGKRGPHDAGKIAMWAWAAQRLLDYAATRADLFDMSCAVVCGHSRLGKTALFAGATDERFTHVYSNNSGCAGASISRGKVGESVSAITRKFHRWFNERYLSYGETEEAVWNMPFDQHFLLAAIAPRCLLVGSASEDAWADPESEFLSAVAASSRFEGGLVCPDRLPEVGDQFLEGRIGYHLRDGEHYLGREDWNRMIRFVNLHRS